MCLVKFVTNNWMKELIEMTVAFSAFYRPDLVGLQHEVPKIDAPPASEKIDPTPFNDGVEVGDTK